jgi:hypothetical protein
MDVFFNIPTLISPNVDDKLIPAISKLVERNILVSYRTAFIKATEKAFLGPGSGLSDSYDPLEQIQNLTNLMEASKPRKPKPDDDKKPDDKSKDKDKKKWDRGVRRGVDKEKVDRAKRGSVGSVGYSKTDMYKADSIEIPKGITFYKTVNLEPTYLNFSITGRPKATSNPGEEITREFIIAMKCVQFKLDGVSDVKKVLTQARNRSLATTWYIKTAYRLFGNWLSKYKKYSGMKSGNNKISNYFNKSMMQIETKDIKKLSAIIKKGGSYTWSPLVIFSKNDFDDKEYKENLWEYKQLVKGGWGDMIVVDDYSEIVNFCFQSDSSCYQLSYSYLRQLFDLDDIIDAGIYAATSSGFGQVGAARTPVTPTAQQRGTKINTNDIMSGNF